jgi:hypothetical protein
MLIIQLYNKVIIRGFLYLINKIINTNLIIIYTLLKAINIITK